MSNFHNLFSAADGLCCYCGCKTWIPGRLSRKILMRRFGIEPGSHGAAKAMEFRRATREHVRRVADGGSNAIANLALACSWCNIARGEATPDQHRENIARAISAGLHPNHAPRTDLSKAEMRRARKAVGLSRFSCESEAVEEATHVG